MTGEGGGASGSCARRALHLAAALRVPFPVSAGLVPLERWQHLIASRAERTGAITGVDRHAHPSDTGSTLRYQRSFEGLAPRHPLPAPLPVAAVDTFLRQARRRYRVSSA
ncbi:hypothetical protein ABT382_20935 [Streptomyces pharetrae]|uniref:hypothetical protein n=1 Tax=Streptomyces pharetrae TaxID=291370 RepID=UPI003363137F